jgi:hypothetical protein
MAKSTKKMMEELQKQALVTAAAQVDRPKRKRGVFTKRDIEAIRNTNSKKIINDRYEAYLEANRSFNSARDGMVVAKINLQNALNKGFVAERRVTETEKWNILGIDQTGAIIYADSDISYKKRFDRYTGHVEKGTPVSLDTEEAKEAWDWTDKDTPELVKIEDYFGGTPDATSIGSGPNTTAQGTSKQEPPNISQGQGNAPNVNGAEEELIEPKDWAAQFNGLPIQDLVSAFYEGDKEQQNKVSPFLSADQLTVVYEHALAEYRKLKSIKEKLDYYLKLFDPPAFFSTLNKTEKKALYKELSKGEQYAVYAANKADID